MTKVNYHDYQIRTFCSKCRYDFGEPSIWYIQKIHPVCPKCGSHHTAYINETGRYCSFIWTKSWWEKKKESTIGII